MKSERRQTEPPPRSFTPLWLLMLFWLAVTASLGLMAFLIDRLSQG